MHQLRVGPLPDWLDIVRLLGPTDEHDGPWELSSDGRGQIEARAAMCRTDAADLAARLRGLGFDGQPVTCDIDPPLPRSAVRRARTEDARRRRSTTPGFTRSGTRDDEEGRMSLTPEPLAMRIAAW